ncbi:MAG: hypothetical protein PHU23_14435, partial [Dehalococcoidales bacterium]|nr:hypothetical protein [Dehalococcoidales bacterium]
MNSASPTSSSLVGSKENSSVAASPEQLIKSIAKKFLHMTDRIVNNSKKKLMLQYKYSSKHRRG